MDADIAQEIGDSHRVCEDYGRANNQEHPFVILADGCSDVLSPDTDFGARLLVKATEKYLLMGAKDYQQSAILEATAQAKGIGLSSKSLDCTLMVARIIEKENKKLVQTDIWGDGAVVGVHKSGRIEVSELAFPSGYPYYLNYSLDESRLKAFQSAGPFVYSQYSIHNKEQSNFPDTEATIKEPFLHLTFDIENYDYVLIMCDGVESFYTQDSKGRNKIENKDIIQQLCAFKSGKGQFMQRRFSTFKKQCNENKWHHYDDFTVGAISLK